MWCGLQPWVWVRLWKHRLRPETWDRPSRSWRTASDPARPASVETCAAAVFEVVSSSEITATVLVGATTYTVHVVTPSTTLSCSVAFRVLLELVRAARGAPPGLWATPFIRIKQAKSDRTQGGR
jgi:hypothetical protein